MLGDGRLLAGRNLKLLARNPASIMGIFVFPLIFLFGFLAVLQRSMQNAGIDYEQYMPPIIVIQAMFFTAMSSAFYLAEDRASGMLERLRSMPIHPSAPAVGRVFTDLVRAMASTTVVLAAASIIGFRFTDLLGAIGFLAVVVLFLLTVASGCSALGLSAKNAEAAGSVLFLIYLPSLMLSTGFVPLAGFPGWIQPFVKWQPVSLTVDALRALADGTAVREPVTEAVIALTVLFVVFVSLAARAFRRAV